MKNLSDQDLQDRRAVLRSKLDLIRSELFRLAKEQAVAASELTAVADEIDTRIESMKETIRQEFAEAYKDYKPKPRLKSSELFEALEQRLPVLYHRS